jgi:hypothetical protein
MIDTGLLLVFVSVCDVSAAAMTPPLSPCEQQLLTTMHEHLAATSDLYHNLNQLRAWFNGHFPEFELYLEDVWNDRLPGKTCFEYIVRSRLTKDETEPFAFDQYGNYRDGKGVWHLGEYEQTVLLMTELTPIVQFVTRNASPTGWEVFHSRNVTHP